MTTKTTSFQTVLDALLDSKKDFPRRYLHQFSDMGMLELKTLEDVWSRVGLSRKLSLLEGLETMAESDTLVNFDEFAKAILDDADSTVRGRAIRLLKEVDDVHLVPVYINILNNDADVQTRAEAANVLGLFVDLGELDEIVGAHRAAPGTGAAPAVFTVRM